jgi:PKD repeat protein
VTFSLSNVGNLAPGEYTGTIAFTNTDTGNGNTTRTATLTVIALPTLTATPVSGVAPLAVTFAARVQPGDTNTYTIDFGDGTNSGPLAIRPSGIACVAVGPCYTGAASASHTYSFQGNYTATLHNAVGTDVATVAIAVTRWGGNARSGFARR